MSTVTLTMLRFSFNTSMVVVFTVVLLQDSFVEVENDVLCLYGRAWEAFDRCGGKTVCF